MDIVEGSTDAIFVKNLDGRYILANGAAARSIGVPVSEILGRRDEEIFPPEVAAETLANDRRVLTSGNTETYESTQRSGDVITHYLSTKFPHRDAHGAIVGVIGIARDITARRTAEEALRAEHNRYEALIGAQGALGIGLVIGDGARRPRFINDAFCALTGYTREELFELPSLMALVAPDRLSTIMERRARQAAGHPQPASYESVLVRKDGSRVDVDLATKPLDSNGDQLVMVRDISEEKRARTQLIASERLAAVGRLAAGLAHEINNPLASVVMNIDDIQGVIGELAAMSRLSGDPALARAVERLRVATMDAAGGADRMSTIVRDVGVFSRAPDDSLTTFDVRDAVRSSVRLADNTVRHRARLELDLADLPEVVGREARLGQVLVNLLVNAAQAIPVDAKSSGVITVRTLSDELGHAIIEVADNGVGISPEHLPHVFEPFFTTKPIGSGTGLGLSVCLGIVRGMGGQLTVQSALGRGTTFRVILPASAEAAGDGPRSSLRTVPSPGRRARLLVVDDDAALGRTIRRALARDHDVEVCVSGREALARLTSGDHFDVVLCDLMMPGLSGDELYAAISARDAKLAARFLFLTGGAVTERARNFVADVQNTCLLKPISPDELRAAVAEALRRGDESSDRASNG